PRLDHLELQQRGADLALDELCVDRVVETGEARPQRAERGEKRLELLDTGLDTGARAVLELLVVLVKSRVGGFRRAPREARVEIGLAKAGEGPILWSPSLMVGTRQGKRREQAHEASVGRTHRAHATTGLLIAQGEVVEP